MCLLVVAWKSHPRYRLVLAGNRDEFHDRPAAPIDWWEDEPRILGGRDMRAGGTWLAFSRSGRFGTVTNFRDLAPTPAHAPSRGSLVQEYLAHERDATNFVGDLQDRSTAFAGFNLLVGDAERLHYCSNRDAAGPRELPPGLYGLSNHVLDEPWPKLVRTRARFAEILASGEPVEDALLDLLADRTRAPLEELPATGVPQEWESALSATFVAHGGYGTRCSTVVRVEHSGHTLVCERRFDASGAVCGETQLEFDAGGALH